MNRKQWLETRRKGIGGSDVGAILGVDPWKDSYDVWLDKMGLSDDSQVETADMKRGKVLEDIVAKIYKELTGRPMAAPSQLMRHPEKAHFIANPDRIIFDDDKNETGVLEIKCPRASTFRKIQREGLPQKYVLQIQHYLYVLDLSWGSFAIFSAELWEMEYWDIERDDELIQLVVPKLDAFWNLVETGTPPDRGEKHIQEIPPIDPKEKIIDKRGCKEWDEAVERYQEARLFLEEAKEEERAAKARLLELMEGADAAECDKCRVYFREQAGRKTIDKKAALADGVDLCKYEKQGKPFKTFKFYSKEEGK